MMCALTVKKVTGYVEIYNNRIVEEREYMNFGVIQSSLNDFGYTIVLHGLFLEK
jgi:hypothetical protein